MADRAVSGESQRTGAQLLRLLRAGAMTPSELAAELSTTSSAVLQQVETLRQAGCDIAQHPLLGLQLIGMPPHLIAEDVLSRMKTLWPGEIRTLHSVDSTNTLGLALGREGFRTPTAIFAEHQTAGRGRFARAWDSQSGQGIWLSILLRPEPTPSLWPRLTTIAALAIARAIEEQLSVSTQIKWPNDVMCGGKKLAGILAETGAHQSEGPFVVLGIGINANQETFPEPLKQTAVSLRQLSGAPVDRAALAAELLEQLNSRLGNLDEGFQNLLQEVRQRSLVLGKELTACVGQNPVNGFAEDLDEEGRLILRLPDGSRLSLAAGEVTLRA